MLKGNPQITYNESDLVDHPVFIEWVRSGRAIDDRPAIFNAFAAGSVESARTALKEFVDFTGQRKDNDARLILSLIENINPWKINDQSSTLQLLAYNLYAELLDELEGLWNSGGNRETKAESLYRIGIRKLETLKAYASHFFDNDTNEIEFFREIKPRFTGVLDFFILLYQAILFNPFDPSWYKSFWQKEKLRYIRFYENYHWLIHYWVSGNHEMDKEWFLRANNSRDTPGATGHDLDPAFFTSADHYVAGFIGQRLYYEYTLYNIFLR